jgi:hypothetical protein
MDEVVGQVFPVHVESEETAVIATRATVKALEWHSVVIENGAVASQKIRYVMGNNGRGREAERIYVNRSERRRLNIDG